MTQPEEGDPLAAKYGDAPMVQSQGQSGRVWTRVEALTPAMQARGSGAAGAPSSHARSPCRRCAPPSIASIRAEARNQREKTKAGASTSPRSLFSPTPKTTKNIQIFEIRNSKQQGQTVLVRARVHAVRGKGKSAFLVLRQRTATAQVVFFANDDTVSKGMVKYTTQARWGF